MNVIKNIYCLLSSPVRGLRGFYFLLIFFASSCSVTKNIPDNDALYDGSTIKLKPANDSIKFNSKDVKEEMETLLRPSPNASFLGIKYKLFFYNLAGTPKGKGLSYWIKTKLGEPPVLGSSINLEKNRTLLENRFENRGYFGTPVTVDTVIKHKQLKVTYSAVVQPQYKIRNVSFVTDSGAIGSKLRELSKTSFLKTGNPYDLDVIKNERERIDANLKESGFFFFNPDFIIVNADSTVGNNQVDMYVTLKRETPDKAKNVYFINNVVVFADYNLENDTAIADVKALSVKYDDYYIYDPQKKFKPIIFSRNLVFKPDEVYNRQAHNLSLNRLVSLGVYKFVKARFQEVDSTHATDLNALYYLTPLPKKSLRFELSGLSKSNNSNGGELSLTWRNRNLLKAAELLSVKVYGGLEKQSSSQQPTVTTNRLGAEINLVVPRTISPFKFKTNRNFVPQTQATLGYELFQRNTQYTLSSSKASFGYIWKEKITTEHQLNIVSINLVQPRSITPEFQDSLNRNITLARSIEKQFIFGSTYNYNYNSQAQPNKKRINYYLNGNLDVSGNIIGLSKGANVAAGKEKTIFGIPFSQYIRTEIDFRNYIKFGKKSILASRALAGVGYAYGNSAALPFVKAFFAGGTNDIRAFRARGLGPGSYYAGNAAIVGFLPDQPGDVKLELNTEFRAKLFSVIYGAVFVDAGNIWLLKDNPQTPGGKFTNKFLNDFAVGTGAGLRVDISFFVLRLDVAFPIRKPYILDGSKWVIKDISFGNSEWRKENLVYNLAIGYPF